MTGSGSRSNRTHLRQDAKPRATVAIVAIMPKTIQLNTSQPDDLVAAARAEADSRGLSLSEFVGEAIRKQLPPDVRKGLGKREARGRRWPKRDAEHDQE